MRIGIQRQTDLAMAQQLLHNLGMNPKRKQNTCRAMTQIVKPDGGQPRLDEQWAERTPEQIGILNWSPHPITEDPPLFVPGWPCCKLCFGLADMVCDTLYWSWN